MRTKILYLYIVGFGSWFFSFHCWKYIWIHFLLKPVVVSNVMIAAFGCGVRLRRSVVHTRFSSPMYVSSVRFTGWSVPPNFFCSTCLNLEIQIWSSRFDDVLLSGYNLLQHQRNNYQHSCLIELQILLGSETCLQAWLICSMCFSALSGVDLFI